MSALDSLTRIVAQQDSLLKVAATRANHVTIDLPRDSTLFSALAGAVTGAALAIIAQMIGAILVRRRTKQIARRRLVDQLLVTRDHISQTGRDLAGFGPSSFLFGTLQHELNGLDAAIAQDLVLFSSVNARSAVRNFRANLGRTLDAARLLTEQVESKNPQLFDTPDVQRGFAAISARFVSDMRRGSRTIHILKSADTFSTQPVVRGMARRVRKLSRGHARYGLRRGSV